MDKRKGLLWLLLGAVVLILTCLLPAGGWRAGGAEAFEQPNGSPGTGADPLLSVNSLRQHLDQLFEAENHRLDTLEERLDLVSQGLQELQGNTGE